MTLTEIIQKKKALEEVLEDAEFYTQELEELWEQQGIALKEKIDAYGFVIEDVRNKVAFLKERRDKIKSIMDKLEKCEDSLKARLHFHAKDGVLEGYEFKFSPYYSKKSSVIQEMVEDDHKIFVFEVNNRQRDLIVNLLSGTIQDPDFEVDAKAREEYRVYPKSVGVTQLPVGHPAIQVELTPSVRIKH